MRKNSCSAVEKEKRNGNQDKNKGSVGEEKRTGSRWRVNRGPKGQRKGINMADAASFMYLYWPLARWACRNGWAQALLRAYRYFRRLRGGLGIDRHR